MIRNGLCLWIVLAGPAWGQWVHFEDETAERLELSPLYADDGQEKDLAVGDFDRDGWDDVVVVRKTPFSNAGGEADLLLMNDEGVLRDRTSAYAPELQSNLTDARDVFVTDIDLDGWSDLVIANTFGQQPVCYRNQGADPDGMWLGFVDETAQRFPILEIPKLQFCAVGAGDVTGNGAPDLYFCNYVKAPEIAKDVLLINDGTGHFTDESEARLGDRRNSAFGTSIDLRDMDRDGDLDVIKTSSLDPVPPWNRIGIFVIFNDGEGTFQDFQSVPADSPYMFAIDDLTSDGLLDLYVVNDSQDFVVTGVQAEDGEADPLGFNKVVLDSPRTGFLGGNVQCADLDGDGDLDVLVADVDIDLGICENAPEDARKFALLRNDGDAEGRLSDPWGAEANGWNQNVFDFVVVDLDRDGKLDLVSGLCRGYAVWHQVNHLDLFPAGDLDFGETIVGSKGKKELRVCNNGTDSVVVTGISSTNPAFRVEGAEFALEPFECRWIEVEFAPTDEREYAGVLRLEGTLEREVAVVGVAMTPAQVELEGDDLWVRTTAGPIERRVITLTNRGGSVLTTSVSVQGSGHPRLLLLAESSARQLVEATLDGLGVSYDLGDLAQATAAGVDAYDILVVALVAGEVSEASMAVLREALLSGKTVLLLGATTDPDYVAGLQDLLSHETAGWKGAASPHFRLLDPDHPLTDGLPAEFDFEAWSASWYRVRPDDADAWVAGENGDGIPSLLSKRVGRGLLVYFTHWMLAVVWSDPEDRAFLSTVMRNGIGMREAPWISVKPRLGELRPGESGTFEVVFHSAFRSPGQDRVDLVLVTNDPLQPEIVMPAGLEVLPAPTRLPELRVWSVDSESVGLDLFGVSGAGYHLEESTDLVNWSRILEVEAEEGLTSLVADREPGREATFYRAVGVSP